MRIPTMAAGCLLAALGVAGVAGRAQAASELVEAVQVHLYAGETAAAAVVAEAELAAHADNDEARFALGTVQFLQAIEHLGQSFHRYGLMRRCLQYVGPRRPAVLPPAGPSQSEARRRSTTRLFAAFSPPSSTISRRRRRRSPRVDSATIDLPLNVGLIRLDLDGDGQGSEERGARRRLDRNRQSPLDPQQHRTAPGRLRCERRPLAPRLLPSADGDRRVSARA